MSVVGKDVRILTDGSANYGFPSWSPDGRQLVFRLAGKERNGLVIIDVATGALKTLTAGVAHDNFPSWSPKGDRIASQVIGTATTRYTRSGPTARTCGD
jgi:Tol biopolymer transport system component